MFEIDRSAALSDEQKRRLAARYGPRVTAIAQDARSQHRNRALALERLGERIAAGLRPRKHRRPTRPNRGARERRLESKKRRSDVKRQRRRPSADE